jgi:thiol-disulfide isomerase/thioredoxin
MKKLLLLSFLVVSTAVTLAAQGIDFETGDWASVLEKAKKEGKLVYVDVYTTWCGPCKMLAQQIFPKKEAGDKYNKLFVNYRIDAEKGEGIGVAKKYGVDGYPTHLFIDPVSGDVVYRDMGASAEVKDFNHHADVAMQEKADPMTWDKYVAAYKSGKKDQAFLKSYLLKAKRLNKGNDDVLNDYVALLNLKPGSVDSEVIFLTEHLQTIDNNAVAYVANRKNVVASIMPDNKDYYDALVNRWIYGTFKKAVDERNESLLKVMAEGSEKYTGKKDEAMNYWFRTQYFTKIGDQQGALKAGMEEADFLSSRSNDYYAQQDEKELENAKSSIRSQLKMMKVPDEKLEELVKVNLEKNPSMRHSASFQAANKLNSIAWDIYEHHARDAAALQQALRWSKRSMDLAAGLNEWPLYADTYAHLLYAAGKKQEAIQMQQEAVTKSKALGAADTASLEDSLKQMKEGKL